MREAEPNWNLERIPMTYSYIRLLFQEKPVPCRPRMERGRRAKIFAPFDALEGFSDRIRSMDQRVTEEFNR